MAGHWGEPTVAEAATAAARGPDGGLAAARHPAPSRSHCWGRCGCSAGLLFLGVLTVLLVVRVNIAVGVAGAGIAVAGADLTAAGAHLTAAGAGLTWTGIVAAGAVINWWLGGGIAGGGRC